MNSSWMVQKGIKTFLSHGGCTPFVGAIAAANALTKASSSDDAIQGVFVI